jgi:hypothetical protein
MLFLDELNGKSVTIGEPHFPSLRVTVRDLIRARVELEVERSTQQTVSARRLQLGAALNDKEHSNSQHVFGPGMLFGSLQKSTAPIHVDELVALAEEGFAKSRFFLLLGNSQAESLDEEIDVTQTAEVLFLLLTPLQGG